jgi:hypothetical protein
MTSMVRGEPTKTVDLNEDSQLYLGPQEGGSVTDPKEIAFSGLLLDAIRYAVEEMDPNRRQNAHLVTKSGQRISWRELGYMYRNAGMKPLGTE